jgi:hypothetical protein
MKKGDNNKGSITRRLIENISLNKDFNDFVCSARNQLGVPEKGFGNSQKLREWLDSNKSAGLNVLAVCIEAQKEFNIPLLFFDVISAYILNVDYGKINPPIDPILLVDYDVSSDVDIFYKENKIPFVKLYIFGTATQEKIVKELRDHWEEIEDSLEHQIGREKTTVRVRKNKYRDQLVYSLYSMKRADLGLKRGEYKDIAISKILKNKYGINIESEAIRAIVKKQRKTKEGRFKFKY